MKNQSPNHNYIFGSASRFRQCFPTHPAARFIIAVLALLFGGLLTSSLQAQTVTIAPQTVNYWAGINTTNVLGVGSNSVTMTGANGTAVNFAVAGQPAGLTTSFSTNSCTNSIGLGLYLNATYISAGVYPLTISGSGAASYSTNVNLFVVPQWAFTNGTANWSSPGSWSGGAAPGANDSVYIENSRTNVAFSGFTNIVDSSTSIQSLIILGDNDANLGVGSLCAMQIPTGVTLSVLGTNGFFAGVKSANSTRPWYDISGAGTLVVSNKAGNFALANGTSSSSTRPMTFNMTNLNNFSATVNRFGAGDATLGTQGLIGGVLVNMGLAKTNTINTTWSDNYNALDFQNSFNFGNNGELASGSLATFLNLGYTNGIYTDSMGIGRSHYQGTSGNGATMRFLPALSNSVAPVASVYIRGTNGLRMPLLAVGVDSGSANSTKTTIGLVDLRGGNVDILVDKIWLGANRTNTAAPTDTGGLSFDNGTVNANTVEAGYMLYTNLATVKGTILVGTNGTFLVNTNLELGHTPADSTGFPGAIATASGQVTINNGGAIRAKQITVGQFSTNNFITINLGGILDVTNTVASSAKMLTSLTNNGGGLTLHLIGTTNTQIYVTNLVAGASSPINIASVAGISSFPATISVIKYGTATSPANWVGGTGPAGLTVTVANNSGNNSIDVTLTTGTPKTLLWRGFVDNNWDLTTKNWLDLTTGLHTNFATSDFVAFDDTASASSINISGDVVPSQAPGGIRMTNNTLSYTFTGSGNILGGATLTKIGTAGVTVDLFSQFAAIVNQGNLTVTASGTIGSATIASGAGFNNNGTVLGSVNCSGTANNASSIIGGLTIQASAIATNTGTVNGSLSMQNGSLLYNAGTFTGMGSPTVATNATLVNAGTLYGSSLTVAVGGTLADTVMGSAAVSAGSINVGSLTVNGTFEPGGSAIATTKVTDYDYASSGQLGNPNGRVQLAAGSITILQVNTANSPQNTKVLSQNQGFGPSQGAKAFNGCELLITNLGPALTAGQTFKFFGAYYADGYINSVGLNSTNAYPIIQPAIPGPGLVWDLSQLIPQGVIGVLSANDPSLTFTLTNTITPFPDNTNVIAELSWPTDKMGGWIQQLTTTLTNGLSATNWTSLSGNYATNINNISLTNHLYFTNTLVPGNAVFYRFVYP